MYVILLITLSVMKCKTSIYIYSISRNLFNISFQEFYNKAFSGSRLQTHSGIDMNHCSVENGFNLFLIPSKSNESKNLFKKSSMCYIIK